MSFSTHGGMMIVMSGMTGGKSVRDEELMGGIQEERYKMNEKYV